MTFRLPTAHAFDFDDDPTNSADYVTHENRFDPPSATALPVVENLAPLVNGGFPKKEDL